MKKETILTVAVFLSLAVAIFAALWSYRLQNDVDFHSYQIQNLMDQINEAASKPMRAAVCGDGVCDPGEEIVDCFDCDPTYCTRACQEQGYQSAAPTCTKEKATFNMCCCEN